MFQHRLLSLVFLLLGLSVLSPCAAQEDDASKPAAPFKPIEARPFGDRLDLTTRWLFRRGPFPGNGLGYTDPALDDSAWKSIDTSEPLFSNGDFNLNEIWYRTHVHLAPGSHDLAVTLADIGGSYRVYANGQELGGHGKMEGRGDFLFSRSATFPIPDSVLTTPSDPAKGQNLVLTVHCFVGTVDRLAFTLRDGIHPKSQVTLGPHSLLLRDEESYFSNGRTESASILTLWTVLCILSLALTFLVRRTPAYRLLAIYAAGHLLTRLLIDYAELHYLPQTQWIYWPINLLLAQSQIAALEFCRVIAGSKRRRWLTAVEVFYLLSLIALFPAATGVFSYAVYAVLTRAASYLLLATVALYLFLGVRRHKQDAYILVGTAALYLFYLAVWGLLGIAHFDSAYLEHLAGVIVHAVPPATLSSLAIVGGFLTVVIVRTLRIVRERASIAGEIEAARTMQQLLLSRSDQPTPGFLVETAYLPAGEVGGDFFLVTPAPDGSLLAILGDVSGKGLRAAMRVSMILGVLRREPSFHPSDILFGLNEALCAPLGSSQAELGFTTACCVRLSPSGHFTIANAGHIAPYIAGQEIATAPALPLGLARDQAYDVVTGQVFPGRRLVLLSDGVLEARSSRGELLGFERLAPLTLKPAAEIATTAQTFGQDDDITVLTLAVTAPSTNQAPPPLLPRRTPPPPPPPPPPLA